MSEYSPPPVPPSGDLPIRDLETDPDARLYGMLCHLLSLTGFIAVAAGFIIGPLVIWLWKREQFAFVDDQGKEALNFQITMLIAEIAASLLLCAYVGIFLLPVLLVLHLVLVIIAAVKANNGEWYRYPFNWRLIR